MASIVLRVDERTQKNGMCPVRVRISHQHQAAWVATGVAVEPQFFKNDSLYDPLSSKAYMAKEKREQLAYYVRKWDEGMFDLLHADGGREQLAQMSAAQLKSYIFGERKKTTAKEVVSKKRQSTSPDFLDWFEQYGDSRNSKNTRSHFAYVWRLLYAYKKEHGMQSLTFRDIDYAFLTDLKAWNRKSRGEATRYKVESYIRAAYRDGMRRGMVSRDCDPFFDYRIERVPLKDIETVSPDTLRRLRALRCNNSETERTRDILLASFYLCGANFRDIYDMPAPKNGVVEFVRSKVSHVSQRTVQIRIEPELAAIIEKYKDPTGERLFSFGTKFEIMQHNFRRGIDVIEDALGERVNFAKIRRTWATTAGELECPGEVIDMSMGHVPATVRDRHYEEYKWSRTARWNRKIIDYTLYNKQS